VIALERARERGKARESTGEHGRAGRARESTGEHGRARESTGEWEIHLFIVEKRNIGFIGFTSVISLASVSEVQAHWLTDYFIGQLELPRYIFIPILNIYFYTE
jgi:hypothetical protein